MIMREPKWAAHLERGGSNFGEDPGRYCIWDFVTLRLIRGMGLVDFTGLGFADICDQG